MWKFLFRWWNNQLLVLLPCSYWCLLDKVSLVATDVYWIKSPTKFSIVNLLIAAFNLSRTKRISGFSDRKTVLALTLLKKKGLFHWVSKFRSVFCAILLLHFWWERMFCDPEKRTWPRCCRPCFKQWLIEILFSLVHFP